MFNPFRSKNKFTRLEQETLDWLRKQRAYYREMIKTSEDERLSKFHNDEAIFAAKFAPEIGHSNGLLIISNERVIEAFNPAHIVSITVRQATRPHTEPTGALDLGWDSDSLSKRKLFLVYFVSGNYTADVSKLPNEEGRTMWPVSIPHEPILTSIDRAITFKPGLVIIALTGGDTFKLEVPFDQELAVLQKIIAAMASGESSEIEEV